LAIEKVLYISVSEAIKLHVLLMRQWRENRFGIDRKELLESALNRPKQTANFENADLIRQAATLCFGLVKNHPWFGGNKRTATFLMAIFLERNSFELTATDEETYEMVLKVESDVWKVDEIENWLRGKVKKLKNA
jgi:death-on-curing protein